MFDTLVHRQDAQVARVGQPPVAVERHEVSEHAGAPIPVAEDAVHKVRTGKVQGRGGDGFADVPKQRLRFVAKECRDRVSGRGGQFISGEGVRFQVLGFRF